MGWFGSSKQEKPDPVSRTSRKKCWESRDAYFACLDRASVLTPGDEGEACIEAKTTYEQDCAKSWIDYFNKRRVLEEQQKDVLIQANVQAQVAARK
ncbi:uncharacterized protein LAESUDRAFT_661530 [Laetiporus sulphureus 93-53]|uniref:Uncharacterized protein n=1 Tax=Laetiporus sulphureus 93-53 TaxID=1314785 RepID=A0A165CC17_9APHY|nr:uncharacterized protein LAESUDRAFT_661530 [Laetiporus sulphureus 93-53]KZT02540.1 hypothetical protein LAESUDRAFT_661530 [Laetiporus sulphureus 93-53]